MPSGYTCAIEKGISFEQFVWSCARGMGALIMMRDSPMDAPVPDKFEPSDYSAKALATARERLTSLRAMSATDADAGAAGAYEKELTQYKKSLSDKDDLRQKYEAMQSKVAAWTPPTADHAGLRTFMLDQISESIKFDCGTHYYNSPVRMTGTEWLEREISKERKNVEYHAVEMAKEQDRTDSRNAWIAALRKSVPYQAP